MTIIAEILTQARQILSDVGIENPALDARLLLQDILKYPHEQIILKANDIVDSANKIAFEKVIQRRAAGEPVSRIIGRREFWGLEFIVSPATLDPRPDSELLIETALRYLPDKAQKLSILDLGTGTGCLLIALLHEYQNAAGTGIDQSDDVLIIAAQNASANQIATHAQWIKSDWWQNVPSQKFDLIVSNPPYIAESDRATLAREVINHDPHAALFGGPDGLQCYHALFSQLGTYLNSGGVSLFEIGYNQAKSAAALARHYNLAVIECLKSWRQSALSGYPRRQRLNYTRLNYTWLRLQKPLVTISNQE